MKWSHRDVPSGKLSHNYGKSPFLIGKATINGPFSIAMLVCRRVGDETHDETHCDYWWIRITTGFPVFFCLWQSFTSLHIITIFTNNTTYSYYCCRRNFRSKTHKTVPSCAMIFPISWFISTWAPLHSTGWDHVFKLSFLRNGHYVVGYTSHKMSYVGITNHTSMSSLHHSRAIIIVKLWLLVNQDYYYRYHSYSIQPIHHQT